MDLAPRTVARALLRTTFVYSMMAAIYLMLNSVIHPRTMLLPLTHLLDWPTEGTALAGALILSFLSFVGLRVFKHLAGSSTRGGR